MYKNIFANLISRIWSLLSIFLFIPLYIHFMGIELFGLVSFFATMQGVLLLLDAGLSLTLRREFSFGEENKENHLRKYKLLRSIEFCYLILIAFILAISLIGAEFIVHQWLNIGTIDPDIAITTIRLMGISIAIQFLSTLYYGGLLGLQKQIITNVYQVGWSILKNGFVLLILWLIAPDIRLFYLWFIFADLVYLVVLKIEMSRSLGVDHTFTWNRGELKNLKKIWRYAAGMLAISVISAFNFQLDKMAISKMLPISDLGIYNLAFSLSQLPFILVNAITIAIFPRFVNYYSTQNHDKLQELFLLTSKILGIFAISTSITMCFYTNELFLFWTRDPQIAAKAWQPASILIAGTLFQTFQIIPFNLALAHGITRINLFFGIVNIIVMIPILLLLVSYLGIMGAAITWLFISLVISPSYNCFVYHKFINKNWLKWYYNDTLLPLLFVLAISATLYQIGTLLKMSPNYTIVYAILTGALLLILTLFLFTRKFYSRIRLAFDADKI